MSTLTRSVLWGVICLVAAGAVYGARMRNAQVYARQQMVELLATKPLVAYTAEVSASVPQSNAPHGPLLMRYEPGKPITIEENRNGDCYVAKSGRIPLLIGRSRRAGADKILTNYKVTPGRDAVIAGRKAYSLNLSPIREGRPEVTWWADDETNVVLRTLKRSYDGKVTSDTRVTRIDYSRSTVAEDNKRKVHNVCQGAKPATDEIIQQKLGFKPSRPTYIPAGFEASKQGLYNCPCGCGTQLSTLSYSDGLAGFSVFQTAKRADHCNTTKPTANAASGQCDVSKVHGLTVAATNMDKFTCAVAGDLSPDEARRVVLSLN